MENEEPDFTDLLLNDIYSKLLQVEGRLTELESSNQVVKNHIEQQFTQSIERLNSIQYILRHVNTFLSQFTAYRE